MNFFNFLNILIIFFDQDQFTNCNQKNGQDHQISETNIRQSKLYPKFYLNWLQMKPVQSRLQKPEQPPRMYPGAENWKPEFEPINIFPEPEGWHPYPEGLVTRTKSTSTTTTTMAINTVLTTAPPTMAPPPTKPAQTSLASTTSAQTTLGPTTLAPTTPLPTTQLPTTPLPTTPFTLCNNTSECQCQLYVVCPNFSNSSYPGNAILNDLCNNCNPSTTLGAICLQFYAVNCDANNAALALVGGQPICIALSSYFGVSNSTAPPIDCSEGFRGVLCP